MSTKPTDVFRWANVGGSITVPPSGKQDVGWVPGEAPPAEYFNWLFNGAYLWFKWLSDGDVSFHNVAATGTLAVTGAATFGSTVGITGLLTAASAAFSGAATFASTVGITGLLTASAGLTLAANTNITLSGTGDLKHGDRVLSLGPHLGVVVTGTPLYALSNVSFTTASCQLILDIPLKAGDQIKSYTIGIFGDGTADVTLQFVKISATNVQTIIDTTTVTNAPAAYVVTTVNPADQLVAAGDFYAISYGATGTTVSISFGVVSVTYDHP